MFWLAVAFLAGFVAGIGSVIVWAVSFDDLPRHVREP